MGSPRILADCVWPDPAPGPGWAPPEVSELDGTEAAAADAAVAAGPAGWRPRGPKCNDVTRMSGLDGTEVDRIFFPRDAEDIKHVLALAVAHQRKVSVRGTKHAMGGHSIAPLGYVVDMARMTARYYDARLCTVTCGAGCTWSDLITYLNRFGKSPRTMQSYSSFSVGGSLAVNGHGITTDYTMSESVVSFRIITWDGRDVLCSRKLREDAEGRELFHLAIGGYGLFGIIHEITMTVMDNVNMTTDTVTASVRRMPGEVVSEFELVYDEVRRHMVASADASAQADVEIKLARLNITDLSSASLYVFRRATEHNIRTVSRLGAEPHQMNARAQLLYKWVMPSMQELRFTVEQATGSAMDWGDENERNHLMYESAVPLAKLYSPLWNVDDTFVLQEYFVPRTQFYAWLSGARPIYEELHRMERDVQLLNTTIRFVEHDTDSFLAYARVPEGCYAFVLYFRLPRTWAMEQRLASYHDRFTQVTLACRGTFYLPYRHHYSQDQMLEAYPQMTDFASKKAKHDPKGIFTNMWFEAYPLKLCPEEYQRQFAQGPSADSWPDPAAPPREGYAPLEVSLRRQGSYRRLLRSPRLRQEYLSQFLVRIFNVEVNTTVFRLMAQAAWNPSNKTDLDIFRSLQTELEKRGAGPGQLMRTWKSITQLRRQKVELTRETAALIGRLGRMGEIHDYVSIGDNGKLVLMFREAFRMRGKSWVVHDNLSHDVPAVMERGCLGEVGSFVRLDYTLVGRIEIPDDSADLVTMNQGLHHLPPERISAFLGEVRRILRAGGLFVVREHDLNREVDEATGDPKSLRGAPVEMLDLAHSVFNAVTGVGEAEEAAEIRAFRPVSEWREIIAAAGLCDGMVYEMEPGDPTWDEMLCFYKPPLRPDPRQRAPLPAFSMEGFEVSRAEAMPQLQAALEQLPIASMHAAGALLERLAINLPLLRDRLKDQSRAFSAGAQSTIGPFVERAVRALVDVVERLQPLFKNVEARDDLGTLVPPELFLLLPALIRKVDSGHGSAAELAAVALFREARENLQGNPNPEQKLDQSPATPITPVASEVRPEDLLAVLAELETAIPNLLAPGALARSGLSTRQQTALSDLLTTKSREDLASDLAWYIDADTWLELKPHLEVVKRRGDPPSAACLLQQQDHPWHHLIMALLEAPRFRLTGAQQAAMSFYGLGDLVRMWKIAQQTRRYRDQQRAQHGSRRPATLAERDRALKVRPVFEKVRNLESIKDVTMVESQIHNLTDVAEVLEAWYGYESITARPSDVTLQVQEHLEVCSRNTNWRGLLVLNHTFLQDMRLDAGATEMDGVRRKLVQVASLGHGGKREFRIRYRSLAEPDPEDLLPWVNALRKRLQECGVTRDLHSQDGEYTWYKLNEWMQVEICQIFGNSLEHTPWFRFPFLEFLKIYFQVLGSEAGIVREKYGMVKAFASMAFFTDAIPGVVMSLLFAQLQLLALPLRANQPASYADVDPERFLEELVVLVSGPVDWREVDPRIEARPVEPSSLPGLFVIVVPTFKPFTDVLITISQKLPNARLIEISNQVEVQVKVAVRPEARHAQLSYLEAQKGVERMLDFQFPLASHPGPADVHVALQVQAPYLFPLLRKCQDSNPQIQVIQVYDFYCG